MSRLPAPGSDSGVWGTILNDFLSVEHNSDGTLKASGSLSQKLAKAGDAMSGALGFVDLADNLRAQIVSISGDTWILTNARWDGTTQEFYRIDTTKAAFGLQLQGQGFIPGEPDLGYYVAGATVWVAQPAVYSIIRNGGSASNPRFSGLGGWELGSTVTQQRQMTIGGGGIEIDGYGTTPYGRVLNNTTGTALARRLVGMTRNTFTALDGYDDSTKESWYWGYAEQYDPNNGNATVSGSPRWTIAHIPANTSPTSGIFNEYLTVDSGGVVQVSTDPTTNLGVATKRYVDNRMKGGEAFFTGNGVSTTFFVTHGIGATPSRAQLTPLNQASIGCWYTKDSTLLGINFASPPANGVSIAVSWTAYP